MTLDAVRLTPPLGWYKTDTADTVFVKGGPWSRMIAGTASTDRIVDDVVLTSRGVVLALPLQLFWDHKRPIGDVVSLRRSETGLYIKARIYERSCDSEWMSIRMGRSYGLSVRFKRPLLQRRSLDVTVVDLWELEEISVVASGPGANADCKLKLYNGTV